MSDESVTRRPGGAEASASVPPAPVMPKSARPGRRYADTELPADWESPMPRRSASTPSEWFRDDDEDDVEDTTEPQRADSASAALAANDEDVEVEKSNTGRILSIVLICIFAAAAIIGAILIAQHH